MGMALRVCVCVCIKEVRSLLYKYIIKAKVLFIREGPRARVVYTGIIYGIIRKSMRARIIDRESVYTRFLGI